VVRLRGLPWSVGKEEVATFLTGTLHLFINTLYCNLSPCISAVTCHYSPLNKVAVICRCCRPICQQLFVVYVSALTAYCQWLLYTGAVYYKIQDFCFKEVMLTSYWNYTKNSYTLQHSAYMSLVLDSFWLHVSYSHKNKILVINIPVITGNVICFRLWSCWCAFHI